MAAAPHATGSAKTAQGVKLASDLRAQNHRSNTSSAPKAAAAAAAAPKVGGEGFEPPKVKPADLQSALVGRLSIRPAVPAWGAGRRSYNALEAAANGFVSSWAV